MRLFVCLAASLVFTGCGVQQVPEAADTVPITANAPIPAGTDDPLTVLKGKTPQERSPAYHNAPDADRAFAVLDAALERVWSLDDPREMLAKVMGTAAEVDPVRTCDRVRTVAPRIWKLNLPPTQRNVWASFAYSVAAQDPNLRDGLLRLAVIDARKALADDKLWNAPDEKLEGICFSDRQQGLNFQKQMLEFNVRLCEAVIEQRADREAAIDLATKLLADAKAKGTCQLGCISRDYGFEVLRNLANLDPNVLLTILAKENDRDRVALFCYEVAHLRWNDWLRDSITETLATASINNGGSYKTASEILTHYKFARAPDRNTRETIPRLGNPEIPKPAGVPWVPPQDLQKLLDDPTKATEADSRLCELAQHMGQWGPADHASDVLKRVKSPYRFVWSSTLVARNLIRRVEN